MSCRIVQVPCHEVLEPSTLAYVEQVEEKVSRHELKRKSTSEWCNAFLPVTWTW